MSNVKRLFVQKIFTDKEMKYCDNKGKPIQHYAVRFAGKEAVIKALYPFGLFLDVTQIEILNKDLEKKIKVKYLKKSVKQVSKSKLKKLPKWKPNNQLIKKIKLNFKK